jgi:hypothetical protein
VDGIIQMGFSDKHADSTLDVPIAVCPKKKYKLDK